MNFMYYTDILSQVLSESEKKYTHTHTKEKEKEKIPHLSLTVFSTFYIASWEGWLLLEGENDSTWGSSTEEILPRSKTDFAEWPSDGICASSNKPRLEPQARGGGAISPHGFSFPICETGPLCTHSQGETVRAKRAVFHEEIRGYIVPSTVLVTAESALPTTP